MFHVHYYYYYTELVYLSSHIYCTCIFGSILSYYFDCQKCLFCVPCDVYQKEKEMNVRPMLAVRYPIIQLEEEKSLCTCNQASGCCIRYIVTQSYPWNLWSHLVCLKWVWFVASWVWFLACVYCVFDSKCECCCYHTLSR